ncbi:MAG TPA: hypothetical protein VIE89_32720 [Candidatus Binatia bacterium]
MDTIFIWLIAGAVMGLLGTFLVASERELKRKRQELEELKNQLADGPVPVISNPPAELRSQDNGEAARLAARNEELLQEVSTLSNELEASEIKLEQLETLRAHLNSKEAEITELRWDRERLQSELATLKATPQSDNLHGDEAKPHSDRDGEVVALKEQLEASRTKIRDLESARPQLDDGRDAEIAALKEQLEASQTKVHDLESTRPQLDDGESRQKAYDELQRSLEVSTIQLQNALAAEQEKQKELEALRIQLFDMQQRHREVTEANLRLQEEKSQHQQKLTNQNQLQVERLVILRQRFEALRSKHAHVSEQQQLIQEEIVSISLLLDTTPESIPEPEPSNGIHEERHDFFEFRTESSEDKPVYARELEQSPPEPAGAKEPEVLQNDSLDKINEVPPEPTHHYPMGLPAAVNGGPVTGEPPRSDLKKKRRFGIFPGALGVLVVAGVVAGNLLFKDSEQNASDTLKPPSVSTAAKTKSQLALMTEHSDKDRLSEKPVRGTPPASPDEARIARRPAQATTAAVGSSANASPASWERYEIIQPTRVFSAPSEHSQLVANIEPGTHVNVVDSRNGWLEIRSKYGRPPGFIPETSAIRIANN